MDVAPWEKHWIKRDFDGFWIVFNGIPRDSMVFNGIHRDSMAFVEI